MVAMCTISSSDVIGVEASFKFSTIASTALSMPLLSSIGGAPAIKYFCALSKMALANTVEVVVPSPASEFVFAAACLMIWAPTFSNGSSSSMNFATVTPSFVMIGLPFSLWCNITFRPRGPNVEATLSANILTPFKIFC